jgi:hypothetical protein
MYALIIFFVFIVIPMAYFYFEAKDEEEGTKCGSVSAQTTHTKCHHLTKKIKPLLSHLPPLHITSPLDYLNSA